MIIDTDFIIDVMDNEPAAVRKLLELLKKGDLTVVTAPTIFELHNGAAQSNQTAREIEKIRRTISGLPFFPLDEKSAERAGFLFGSLYRQGRPIGSKDCMVAAIALNRGERVLTRNVAHFKRISGLAVDTY